MTKKIKIEALHQFHDEAFAENWSTKFTPSIERTALFNTIYKKIKGKKYARLHILELGIGPGYLADFLLQRLHGCSYEGVDFSLPMLDIARRRLLRFLDRVSLVKANLTKANWAQSLTKKPTAVVSTWALHDLMRKERIASVYRRVYEVLAAGGILLNGDFVKPESSTFPYEGGRIKPSEHLELLSDACFTNPEFLGMYEENLDNPTTANNYACFLAIK